MGFCGMILKNYTRFGVDINIKISLRVDETKDKG